MIRASGHLGIERERLYALAQVHGTTAVVLSGNECHEAVAKQVGDILVSRAPGVACAVRTADCVPVLLADRRTGAVAAIHAGWRGTVARVVELGVGALRMVAGGSVDLVAAIGPHIEGCCFEVSDDVASALAACSCEGSRVVHQGRGNPRVDLRRIVRAQLEATAVGPKAIDDVLGCTACNPGRFYSHRRDGARSGRMLSAIVTRGAA